LRKGTTKCQKLMMGAIIKKIIREKKEKRKKRY
jgi:hypothetical protein